MSASSQPSQPAEGLVQRRYWLLAGCAVALLTPVLYGYLSRTCKNPDPFMYAQVGKELLAGRVLYQETWMDKPPLGMMLYALPQIAFPRSYLAMGVFFGVYLVLQGLLYCWVFRATPQAAFCCLLAVTMFPATFDDFAWLSTEHLSNLFVAAILLLGYALFRTRRFSLWQCAALGLLTCLTFHIRQNTALAVVVPALGIVLAEGGAGRKLLGLAAIAVAGLASWAVVLAVVMAIGDLRGYYYAVFEYPRAYARAGSMMDAVRLLQGLFLTQLPWILIATACVSIGSRRYRWLAVAGLAVVFAYCILPMRPFTHYWASLLPVLALLLGIVLDQLQWPKRPKLFWTAALMMLLVPTVLVQIVMAYKYPTYLAYARVAALADRLAPPGATLMVSGDMTCEAVQFASALPAAHTIFTPFQLTPPWCDMLPRELQSIFNDYLEKPPGVLAIRKDYLQAALSADEVSNDIRLVRLLRERHDYQAAGETDDFVILVRSASR